MCTYKHIYKSSSKWNIACLFVFAMPSCCVEFCCVGSSQGNYRVIICNVNYLIMNHGYPFFQKKGTQIWLTAIILLHLLVWCCVSASTPDLQSRNPQRNGPSVWICQHIQGIVCHFIFIVVIDENLHILGSFKSVLFLFGQTLQLSGSWIGILPNVSGSIGSIYMHLYQLACIQQPRPAILTQKPSKTIGFYMVFVFTWVPGLRYAKHQGTGRSSRSTGPW